MFLFRYYYYLGKENVGYLPGGWITSRNLPVELNKAMDKRYKH